jgi:glycosyltransferase involved in cell wall biosynthesis
VKLSVCIITLNEEANIGRTLKSVQPLVANGQGEIIMVDSGSTDKTVEIAKSYGAKVFTEPWKGFAGQKNSALEKAQGEWILSLDADEEVESELANVIPIAMRHGTTTGKRGATFYIGHQQHRFQDADIRCDGYWIARRNFFLQKWLRHGGYFPDAKLRLFRRGAGQFESRAVHEDLLLKGRAGWDLTGGAVTVYRRSLAHHAYPTLSGYIEHMNKYSSLGAEMEIEKGRRGFSLINIVIRPWLTFVYNYFFRLGFLDGKEGLLLHMYHAVYVSWKYAKVWELSRKKAG